MATPSIWYYPGRYLHEIDLGRSLTDLDPLPSREVVDSSGIGGSYYRTLLGGGLSVRIRLEGISLLSAAGVTLVRELESMVAHLQRGGAISLAADSDKCWLGHTGTGTPVQGETYIGTPGGNRTAAYGGATPVQGDEMWVESALPEGLAERCRVGAGTVTDERLPLSDAIRYDYSQPCTVRHERFFPALMQPDPSQVIVVYRHRIFASLDMTLYQPPAWLETANTWTLRDTSGTPGFTLDELVRPGQLYSPHAGGSGGLLPGTVTSGIPSSGWSPLGKL